MGNGGAGAGCNWLKSLFLLLVAFPARQRSVNRAPKAPSSRFLGVPAAALAQGRELDRKPSEIR